MQQLGSQFVRFFIVGVGATLLHWGVYVSLNALFSITAEDSTMLSLTYSLGYGVSFLGNYLASLRWTFRTKGSVGKGAGFALSHAVNYALHVLLLNIFLWLGVGQILVRLFTTYTPALVQMVPLLNSADALLPLPIFCVVVPINFLMVRFFLTRGDEKMLD